MYLLHVRSVSCEWTVIYVYMFEKEREGGKIERRKLMTVVSYSHLRPSSLPAPASQWHPSGPLSTCPARPLCLSASSDTESAHPHAAEDNGTGRDGNKYSHGKRERDTEQESTTEIGERKGDWIGRKVCW